MPHLRENLDLVQIITASSVMLKLVGGGGGGREREKQPMDMLCGHLSVRPANLKKYINRVTAGYIV